MQLMIRGESRGLLGIILIRLRIILLMTGDEDSYENGVAIDES